MVWNNAKIAIKTHRMLNRNAFLFFKMIPIELKVQFCSCFLNE
jgi:hypothetical protein